MAFRIILLLLLLPLFVLSQSRTDLELRLTNSFVKLYEDPDVALRAAKEIRTPDDAMFVNDLIAAAQLLRGEYAESARTAFAAAPYADSRHQTLVQYMLARQYYHLNLYSQTAKILTGLTRPPKQISEQKQLLHARIYQLKALNFRALNQTQDAVKNLQLSDQLISDASTAAALVRAENKILAIGIDIERHNLTAASQKLTQLAGMLAKNPRAVYLQALAKQLQGELYFERQQYQLAHSSARAALLALQDTTYEPLRTDLYSDLSRYCLALNDVEQQEHYRKLYDESSGKLAADRKEARRDVVTMQTELADAQHDTTVRHNRWQLGIILGISAIVLLAAGIVYAREVQRSKTLLKQVRFFRSVQSAQRRKNATLPIRKEPAKKQLIIPKEKEQELLQRLQQFEQAQKYLDNNMSLATLAAMLETNTKYLSEVINKYKDRNFNTYINELRVKYIIDLLAADPSYLQYKISYIAALGGFTSHSAFTNVFKSITGMSPNDYMHTLRKTT